MVSGSALASAAVRRKTSATATNARIKALLDVFASVILCNTYCFEHAARIERSEIREKAVPHSQRGPAFRGVYHRAGPRPGPGAQCGPRRPPLVTRRIQILLYREIQLETRHVLQTPTACILPPLTSETM